jgi:hypothetical protein
VLARIEDRLKRIEGELDGLRADNERLRAALTSDNERVRRILRSITADDSGNRRRLALARSHEDYARAFEDPDPLVSIVIPTHDRAELLRGRSVASALAQTHANVEVIVVGDDSPPAVEATIAEIGDPRVSFHRLATPYKAANDERSQWLIRSVMARREGLGLARGRWLVAFDDDDQMRPDQVERLLALAREHRAEVSYGSALRHWPDATERLGGFPPQYGQFTWQCAIYHAGLAFFERQLVAHEFAVPSDWFMCEAMLRAGVRFAMLDDVVCEIYPSEATRAERDRQQALVAHVPPPEAPATPATTTRTPLPVTPWDSPSRFGAPGRLARRALRRVLRPLEVRQREADQSLAEMLDAQRDTLDALGSEVRALRDQG